ncbi:calcium-dependent mitochondrial ATP-magnesium/phosphate carrier protein 2 isoform X3 [Macadamia integrifolia]|uniref:calcium-dependent mitochondrial ATP-magnesium/phosphate carrier protein 2 isoform X3 n=1 Tax=Macadamia integrifolia TaxID=60698 RepID=UPI001C4FACA4|nr:calcium-dependent mitochondrial ATP-magnesium/phosphate carrier protein 2 isoform X3 [Macadamia integrifolia]
MLSANDPVDSFFNSLHAVKGALSPLESGIRRAAKDLESCWAGPTNEAINLELFPKLNFAAENSKKSSSLKKKQCEDVLVDDRKKNLVIKFPIKTFLGTFFPSSGANDRRSELLKKGSKEKDSVGEKVSCTNCLQFAVTWSLLLSNFVQAIPSPFKIGKKRFQRQGAQDNYSSVSCKESTSLGDASKPKQRDYGQFSGSFQNKGTTCKEGDNLSLELLIGLIFDQITQNLQLFDQGNQRTYHKSSAQAETSSPSPKFDHLGVITGILKGKKADVDYFLGSLRFAKVGGMPPSLVGATSPVKVEGEDEVSTGNREETESSSPQKLANGLLNIPLSNVERLRSTLSTVSLTEMIELLPQLGKSSKEHPDKKKLFSVQDFFRYTESEGRRFFEELDRDGDGQVTLEDLEVAMRKRRLPRRYAREFMHRTRSHLFSKSFGWKQFLSLMEQKEPTILRAYTTLCLSKSGTLQRSEILTSLKNAGLPANEDNAVAMMRFLNADTKGSISYGHFRNFMLLLPSDRLEDDPRNIWFEAATVAIVPSVEVPAGSVLKSALAGGLSCALSAFLMHPIDTVKTQVQASTTLSLPELVSKLPQIGVQGLYRGSIPAILGQFSSHGLRTGICEASKLVLVNVAPTLPEIQVETVASFCSTILGTVARIPCEVLKQRLQAGIYENVGEAIVDTLRQDGIRGFFRGTGATLCREVPFYVAGMGLYAESKKVVQKLLKRDLEPWESMVVGAISGGLASVTTTPFDVIKTRMMIASQGMPVSMSMMAFSILRQEGPLALFKGVVPRFFWVAPLGAINLAGYELLRKAMDKT